MTAAPAQASKSGMDDARLLIYAPVPLFRHDGKLWLERQACNGMRLWAENFARVDAIMPFEDGAPPPDWRPVDSIGPNMERIGLHPVPTAWTPRAFLGALPTVRQQIAGLIEGADYLSFAIGGLIGDWGAVACRQAHRMGRPYAVWTDRVESAVTRRAARDAGPWKPRLRARLTWRPMRMLERHVIARATLGLFHGQETFATYAPWCRNPQLVHDIHISRDDHIDAEALAAKQKNAASGPLRIAYVGRADPMKGPMDWLAVLETLAERGVDFRATWLGDGSELGAMRARVQDRGLGDRIDLPGFSDDRAALLRMLREAQVFLFCHKTPESPRNLIEALISAAPIVGYDSPYPADLIAANGGGRLVPMDDVSALARAVTSLDEDRAALATLVGAAARDGAPFDDEAVFAHRSKLIRQHLPAPRR